MSQRISGPGVGLPLPQSLYPASLQNMPVTPGTNRIDLPAGGSLPIPAGVWLVTVGKYSLLQRLDPVTGAWRVDPMSAMRGQVIPVLSDGFTRRVANLTGCPVGAIVTNGGTGYVESTTTVTPSIGNSTWYAVVGGAVGTITLSTAALGKGSGYGMAPLVFIPAPPTPGVQATAVAAISSGTISSIVVTNAGAGYDTAPSITILPNPVDPNFIAGNVNASYGVATSLLTGTTDGIIKAIICTNPGAPTTGCPSLTLGGAGASGAATALWMSTVTSTTTTVGGGGYAAPVTLTTIPTSDMASDATNNPQISLTGFVPRNLIARVKLTTGVMTASTIYDPGLFLVSEAPTAVIQMAPDTQATGVLSAGSITIVIGGATDTIDMQPV